MTFAWLPHTLATWVGEEAERRQLWLKGENALAGDLSDGRDWILIDSLLDRPSRAGLFHGVTRLRMSDIVDK